MGLFKKIADYQGTLHGVDPTGHSHSTSEGWLSSVISSLQTLIAGKANAVHTHTKSQVTDFAHTHNSDDVYWLPQGEQHSYPISAMMVSITYDISRLESALDGKAALSHTHSISDVTGLQVTLTGLQDEQDEINGKLVQLNTAISGKASLNHTHSIYDIDGLSTRLGDLDDALDEKAALSHTHSISNVTGLQTALDGKADVINTVEELELDEETNKVMMGSHIKNGHSYLISSVSGMAWEDLFSSPSGEYIQTSYQGTEDSKYFIPGSDIIITVFIKMFNNIKVYYIALNSVFGYGK